MGALLVFCCIIGMVFGITNAKATHCQTCFNKGDQFIDCTNLLGYCIRINPPPSSRSVDVFIFSCDQILLGPGTEEIRSIRDRQGKMCENKMDTSGDGYSLIFTVLVNSYNNYNDLDNFATQYGLRDDAQVQARLRFLLDRDVQLMVSEIDELNEMEVSLHDTQDGNPPVKRLKLNLPSTSNQVGGADADDLPNKAYYIEKRQKRTFKSTQATDTSFKVRFNEEWRGEKLKDISDRLRDMFDDVLSQAKTHNADLGRVVIEHPDLSNPIVVPLQPWENIDADTVMSEITKVLNSDENLDVVENMIVTVGSIDMPKGGMKKPITQLFGPGNSLQKKRSLFYVENDNNLCLAISVGLCFLKLCEKVDADKWSTLTLNDTGSTMDKILKHRKVSRRYYNHILDKNRKKKRTDFALQLCRCAGLPTTRYLGLNDIPRFEQLLNVNIFVISSKVGDKFVRILQNEERPNLYLYHIDTETEKHWHGIANIQGFFKGSYFCKNCLQPYKSKQTHSCESSCTVCLDQDCRSQDPMSCRSCGRVCRSLACFKRHKHQKKTKKTSHPSQCELLYQCKTCRKGIKYAERQPDKHICGEWKCPTCFQYHVGEHFCYQRSKLMPDVSKTKKKFIFYDFETRQDEQMVCYQGYNPSKIRCRHCSKCSTPCESCKTCRNCGSATCGLYQHLVNFAVLQTACDLCKDEVLTPDSKCFNCGRRCHRCSAKDKTGEFERWPCSDTCGFREIIFKGDETMSQFCNFITQEHCSNFILLAHNAKSFDLYPVLETLIERHGIKPDNIIYNGSKIMYMHVANKLNLAFIDSLNFIPEPLAKLPKVFELEELCKGFFPHTFNKKSNQTYSGCYPSPYDYGYNMMSKDRRKSFLEWYKERENETFDFQKEMLKYCRSDVDILRRGCLKFRELMMSVTGGIDPFDYVTIASVCMGIYKTLFLREEHELEIKNFESNTSTWYPFCQVGEKELVKVRDNYVTPEELCRNDSLKIGGKRFLKSSIAAIPSNGYVTKDTFSKSSIQWLEWIMEQSRRKNSNLKIQHALNGGEFKIPGTNYKCDGFDNHNNTIYEFYGCTFHGCPHCFPHNRSAVIHPTTKQSLEELYTMTMKREAQLRSLGYKLCTCWEHDFYTKKKRNKEMFDFVEQLDIQDRLNPRDSFFGGRTNATKLHYAAAEGEKIQYYDFTSLYPWTNKYCRYPSCHPTIITDNFFDITEYFGIAKIKVLPPRGLYHPVLPYTSNGKLKFPLCRTCSNKENKKACTCTEEERSIVGTWCTPEIQKAVEKGYNILKIYEIYHFEESTKYDPDTGKGGLFTDYVNMFLKLKQEASGFPPECKSDGDKREYIRQYEINEGIKLEYEKIKVNQGLRNLAKLCLNSFWGKFGQRLQLKQSQYIHESEVETLFRMLTDPRKEVHNFHIITKDILQLEWSHDPLFLPFDVKTNIFLASFTTMWARLRLYSVLEVLDRNVLYYDTDSVIFCSENSDDLNKLPIGNYLGELTNEIDSKDGYIVEFVSGGPKNYAYRTLSGKEVCKVRGFTLNWANANLINFAAVKSIICDDDFNEITVINPCKISRDAKKRKLYNRVEKKKYKMVYTKRRILENYDTEPFGY